jgi:hypothetical protein
MLVCLALTVAVPIVALSLTALALLHLRDRRRR